MTFNILIAGAGNIGSRHLQGIANCAETLEIYVIDTSKQSLLLAKQRWEQMFHQLSPTKRDGGGIESEVKHKITFLFSFKKIPKEIDIAFVTTNADVRPQVIKQILRNCEVQYWILEKFLAQSEELLGEMSSLTNYSGGVWVNTPRRMMPWQKQIHNTLPKNIPLNVKANGNEWGLASNGIHCLDLLSWWTGEKLIKIDNSELDPQWIKSKRDGFFEITGKLKAVFSGGSNLFMESRMNGPNFKWKIESKRGIWEIDETNGVASGPGQALITGKNEMQSSMNSRLVSSLLKDGTCDLTKLSESIELHSFFLRSLLDHWNSTQGAKLDILPIT